MPQATRARNAEATRAALLVAARRRFTLLGYARTTTRDIAAEAGVNVALISRYFGSKDGLLAAVLDGSTAMLDEASTTDPVDAFVAGLRPDAHSSYDQEHPLRLLLRGSGDDEGLARLRAEALETAIAVIARSAPARRPDDDDPEPGVRPRLRADLVLALFAGIVMLREALPLEPISSEDLDLLRDELDRTVTATLG